MTPLQALFAISSAGTAFSAWALGDAVLDLRHAYGAETNGLRRIATEMFVGLHATLLVGYSLWFWLCVDALHAGSAGEWNVAVARLVAAETAFGLVSVGLRISRMRLDRYRTVANEHS
jgi:hypothetical protein